MNTHRINPVGDDNLVDHHSWSGPPSVRGPATADLPSGPNLARCRSALYVDFDNVFSGLHQVNPDLAHAFAGRPDRWLDRLAGLDAGWGHRDFLVRRVYLNPGVRSRLRGRIASTSPGSGSRSLRAASK